MRWLLVATVVITSGCCFGGAGIPANPAQPAGYVSGPPYAHCTTQTTPFLRCTEVANTGPTSGLGRAPDPTTVPTSLAQCGLQRPALGECSLEGALGACLSGEGRRLYVDYGPGASSWGAIERACTAERPTARYVRAAGADLPE